MLVLAAHALGWAPLVMAGKTTADPRFGDFSDYVAAEDVVAEGILVSRQEVHRFLAGGCGIPVDTLDRNSFIGSVECVVRIDEVVIGSMVDSTIAFVLPESEGMRSMEVIAIAQIGRASCRERV